MLSISDFGPVTTKISPKVWRRPGPALWETHVFLWERSKRMSVNGNLRNSPPQGVSRRKALAAAQRRLTPLTLMVINDTPIATAKGRRQGPTSKIITTSYAGCPDRAGCIDNRTVYGYIPPLPLSSDSGKEGTPSCSRHCSSCRS
ncbi:hypothetical protein TYRP_003242 [Tyrophagus putrescentiae]|nr:hypothetical protein TYRP_003242 [Tyrophagus putrescentiae]